MSRPLARILKLPEGRIFGTLAVRGLTMGGTFLQTFALARTLTLTDFGRFSTLIAIVTVLSLAARLGTDTSLLRFGGAAWLGGDRPRYRSFARLTVKVVCATTVSLQVVMSAVVLAASKLGLFGLAEGLLLTLAVFPWAVSFTMSTLVKSVERTTIGAALETGSIGLLSGAAMLVASALGHRGPVVAAALILVAGLVVLALSVLVAVRLDLLDAVEPPEAGQRQEFIAASRRMWLVSVVQAAAGWAPTVFLLLADAPEEVAGFSVAVRFAMLVIVVRVVTSIVVSPRLAQVQAELGGREAERIVQRYTTLTLALSMVFILPMLVVPEVLLGLFGAEYVQFGSTLRVLAVGQLLASMVGLSHHVLAMAGREKALVRSHLTAAAAGLVALAVAGAMGSALASACGTAAYWSGLGLYLAHSVRRHLGFWAVPSLGATQAMTFRAPR